MHSLDKHTLVILEFYSLSEELGKLKKRERKNTALQNSITSANNHKREMISAMYETASVKVNVKQGTSNMMVSLKKKEELFRKIICIICKLSSELASSSLN